MSNADPGVPFEVDEIDRRLILLLRDNGRISNRELAKLTGVSQVTVANRIRRLLNEEVIRIQAVLNPDRLGFTVEVIIGIHADVTAIRSVAEALVALDEIRYVTITSGAYDILVAALLHSNWHLMQFLTETLASIPGIRRVETAHALDVLKRNPDWVAFPES
jgi:Lrp/AsnC family transcriptional regulator for asnA, asnC and gidA